jgi:hypothetical protein
MIELKVLEDLPMTYEALRALRGSIQKWHNIVYHNGLNKGTMNCSLCKKFPSCWDCPVYEHTGLNGCNGTPYGQTAWGRAETAGEKAAALAELEFLVCLLPEGKEAKMKDGTIWYWEWE